MKMLEAVRIGCLSEGSEDDGRQTNIISLTITIDTFYLSYNLEGLNKILLVKIRLTLVSVPITSVYSNH